MNVITSSSGGSRVGVLPPLRSYTLTHGYVFNLTPVKGQSGKTSEASIYRFVPLESNQGKRTRTLESEAGETIIGCY